MVLQRGSMIDLRRIPCVYPADGRIWTEEGGAGGDVCSLLHYMLAYRMFLEFYKRGKQRVGKAFEGQEKGKEYNRVGWTDGIRQHGPDCKYAIFFSLEVLQTRAGYKSSFFCD